MAQNSFSEVLFFTDIELKIEGVKLIKIPSIRSKSEYSYFVMKELWRHITTDFTLSIQHDGFTLNGDLFDERLYECDYAGALWINEAGYENGNGGYSWKSRKLLEAIGRDELIRSTNPEDAQICRTYRDYLEKTYGLVWASDDVCEGFSYELRTPIKPTMGFHQYFHEPFKKTVVIRREAALGDVIQVEPVLEYFYSKGYRVVLDTLPQFHLFFINHYFKVHQIGELDQRLLDTAEVFNLDMSYESTPKQLHLKTYFEFCGVTDYVLRNPKLSMGFNAKSKEFKLFPKYCILHIDKREQASRNIEGVDWYKLVQYLISKGYTIIQLGRGEHVEVTGAIQMNTINETILSYVCAGADLFIGIDSGISHICSGYDVPSVICFGNVNPEYIHADMSNKICLTNKVCDTPFCWHNTIGCEGTKCYIDNEYPPCNQFSTTRIINSIEQLWK